MRRIFTVLLVAVLIIAHIALVANLTKRYKLLNQTGYEDQVYALPSQVLRIIAFDYKGLASDFLFIKGIVYIGGFISGKGSKRFKLSENQWSAFYHVMDTATDLDPYFQDPYYLANAFLSWDAGMIHETNTLLAKGSKYRDWDWVLPFLSGFNSFYFLQENDKASEKLMEASRRNGNNQTLASLASKLAFKSKKTENAIAFLEEVIKNTDDIATKKEYKVRIDAYKSILTLERAIDVYRKKFGSKPKTVTALVTKKIISVLPKEPYGGEFYIDVEGNVKTTSEQKLLPYVLKQ